MKPVRLEFQGFNSFSEKAEIDFTALLSGGVFGIFGKTGSGKSTILDCIMYALFAKTSRSQTIAEYVNDKCRSAYVDFTFEILSCGERKTYNVKRTIKLNKQNKPDTSVVLSVAENDFVRPIAEGEENAKIREIIGIGYEEFSKCIILPQNEFAVFVKSTRRDRLLLVSKLFSLQKYDKLLTEATKKRKAEEMLLLSGIDGELNQLSEYTEEYLEQLKAAFIAQKTQLSEYNIKLKEAEEKVGEMQYYYGVSKQAAQNASVLEDLNEKRPRIEELKRKAAAGTLASVIAREYAALTEKENRLKKARAERDKYLSLKLSAEREAAVTDEKLSGNISGEISSLSETIGIMRANSSVAEEIDSLRLAFASATAEHDACNIENERLTCEIRRLSEQIAAFGNPSEKFEKLLLEVGATAAGRELSDELNYFRSKRSAAERWSGERIYGELVKEIDLRIAYVSEKIAALSAGETDADDLIERLTEIRAAGSKIEELNGLLSEKRAEIAAVKERAETLISEKRRLSEEGKAKRAILADISEKTGRDVTSKALYNAALAQFIAEKERLQAEYSALSAKKTELAERISAAAASIAGAEERILSMEKECDALNAELAVKVSSGGFESAAQASLFALDERDLSVYNKEIEEFEKGFASASALGEKLSEILSASGFDEGVYLSATADKESLSERCSALGAANAAIADKIKETEKKIGDAKSVRARRAEVGKRLDLLEKLEKVLSNHNLLNFIAEEYLTDISVGASATLLTLTGGRYDLFYDGEFFVSDNLSCGERRPVSTLSGGETFLVSLSLALALSQAICEKTMRPVEFFFLDEGFGTLDTDLTDLVLDSLDKLRGEHFAIGLISHVPELKQRISSKILVTGATATEGSKIEIVC